MAVKQRKQRRVSYERGDRVKPSPSPTASLLLSFISAAHPGDFSLHLHPSLAAYNCEYTDRAMLHCTGQRGEGSVCRPLEENRRLICTEGET